MLHPNLVLVSFCSVHAEKMSNTSIFAGRRFYTIYHRIEHLVEENRGTYHEFVHLRNKSEFSR